MSGFDDLDEGQAFIDPDHEPRRRLRVTFDSGYAAVTIGEEERPKIAALALYGQPFGFTRGDVTELADAAEARDLLAAEYPGDPNGDALRSLAARIAALLPPEEAGAA